MAPPTPPQKPPKPKVPLPHPGIDAECCRKLLEALGRLQELQQVELESQRDCCRRLLETLGQLERFAQVETQMVAMCDCRPDEEGHSSPPGESEPRCIPFLRVFRVDKRSSQIELAGDFTYEGREYGPRGNVRPEAQCCECATGCGCGETTKLVDYDLCCLFERGGLTNFTIAPGATLQFDPPLTSAAQLASALNGSNYLGHTTWQANWCHLTLRIPAAEAPPGPATGCRFRRFTATVQLCVVKNEGIGKDVVTGGVTRYEAYSDLANLAAYNDHTKRGVSCMHYLHSFTGRIGGGAEANFTGNTGTADMFRSHFQDVSGGNSPQLRTTTTPSLLSDTAAQANWRQALRDFLQGKLDQWLTPGAAFVHVPGPGQLDATTGTGWAQVLNHTLTIDVPCNVELTYCRLTDYTNAEMERTSGTTVVANWNGTNWGPADFKSNVQEGAHRPRFVEDRTVGAYVSTPSVDGAGGSVNWPADCGPADRRGAVRREQA